MSNWLFGYHRTLNNIYLVKTYINSAFPIPFPYHAIPFIVATSAMNATTREFRGSATEPRIVTDFSVNSLRMELRYGSV